jgi:predicted dehydrogenase
MHAPAAKAFLKAGIHVISDKPLALNAKEGRELVALAKKTGRIFAVTYNYTGYPMTRQLRAMIAAGEIGEVRVVQVEYAQDWLTEAIEKTGQKQADWRTDPKRSGAGGALGDIGTHAYSLACFVTGLTLDSLCADLTTFVKGRKLDDNDNVLLRFKGGAKGMLWSSQVAVGNENALAIRVFGSKGSLQWKQEDPNYLWHTPFGQPPRKITRGGSGADGNAGRVTRTPSGHPEGYLEGFANLYAEIARAIRAARTGTKLDPAVIFPTVEDGLKGMEFIEACVKSNAKGATWVKV